MQILQTALFNKQAKKLHPNQKRDLDSAITEIIARPEIGVMKKGDLTGVHVHKFFMNKQLILLAYEWHEEDRHIILLSLGSHENFYRDLKN